jgi:hypothetical protein
MSELLRCHNSSGITSAKRLGCFDSLRTAAELVSTANWALPDPLGFQL